MTFSALDGHIFWVPSLDRVCILAPVVTSMAIQVSFLCPSTIVKDSMNYFTTYLICLIINHSNKTICFPLSFQLRKHLSSSRLPIFKIWKFWCILHASYSPLPVYNIPSLLLQGEAVTSWGIVKGSFLIPSLPSLSAYRLPSLGSGRKLSRLKSQCASH